MGVKTGEGEGCMFLKKGEILRRGADTPLRTMKTILISDKNYKDLVIYFAMYVHLSR